MGRVAAASNLKLSRRDKSTPDQILPISLSPPSIPDPIYGYLLSPQSSPAAPPLPVRLGPSILPSRRFSTHPADNTQPLQYPDFSDSTRTCFFPIQNPSTASLGAAVSDHTILSPPATPPPASVRPIQHYLSLRFITIIAPYPPCQTFTIPFSLPHTHCAGHLVALLLTYSAGITPIHDPSASNIPSHPNDVCTQRPYPSMIPSESPPESIPHTLSVIPQPTLSPEYNLATGRIRHTIYLKPYHYCSRERVLLLSMLSKTPRRVYTTPLHKFYRTLVRTSLTRLQRTHTEHPPHHTYPSPIVIRRPEFEHFPRLIITIIIARKSSQSSQRTLDFSTQASCFV